MSERILALINEAAPRIAVVFSGREPRLIGTVETASSAAAVKSKVDLMLFSQRLSATKITIAVCNGDDRRFVLAHG